MAEIRCTCGQLLSHIDEACPHCLPGFYSSLSRETYRPAEFKKETYGAVVATILETEDSIVEVQERNDGVYGLIIHTRRQDADQWDDLTAYLKPEHFDLLGSIARRMRGEPECCRGAAPPWECQCEKMKNINAATSFVLGDRKP